MWMLWLKVSVLGTALRASTQPALPHSTMVWFDLGHRVVASIAESRLTPASRAAVDDLLGGQSMADASVWADQIKNGPPSTAALHFVNIPLAADHYDSATMCPAGACVIAAIERYRRELADTTRPAAERTAALKFLIHLVGDLHQPLHVADHDDRGGNQTPVRFFGAAANLHQVWDGKLIEEAGYNDSTYLVHLKDRMRSLDLDQLSRGGVIDWAMGGHRIAVEHAYRIPPSHDLSDRYEQDDLPLVDRAIIEAGVRLARVLNEALAGYRPTAAAQSLHPGVYSDRQAISHVGDSGMVVGRVVSVHRSRSGNIHINFGAEYPNQSFSVFIERPAGHTFDGLDSLVGHTVGVTGTIRRYQGSAEIIATSRAQIVVQP